MKRKPYVNLKAQTLFRKLMEKKDTEIQDMENSDNLPKWLKHPEKRAEKNTCVYA